MIWTRVGELLLNQSGVYSKSNSLLSKALILSPNTRLYARAWCVQGQADEESREKQQELSPSRLCRRVCLQLELEALASVSRIHNQVMLPGKKVPALANKQSFGQHCLATKVKNRTTQVLK